MANLRQLLESPAVRAEIVPHIYGGDGERWYPEIVREVLECARKNPRLDPDLVDMDSMRAALTLAVEWPLRIGAPDGVALMTRVDSTISTKPQVLPIQTARAKRKILHERGGVRWMNQQAVFANEKFVPVQGEHPGIERHEQILDRRARGSLVGAYAIALQKHGLPKSLVVLERADIDNIRVEWSEEWGGGDLDEIPWYAIKTASHALCDDHLILPETTKRLLAADKHGKASRFDAPEATVTAPVVDPAAVIERAASGRDVPIAYSRPTPRAVGML